MRFHHRRGQRIGSGKRVSLEIANHLGALLWVGAERLADIGRVEEAVGRARGLIGDKSRETYLASCIVGSSK